MSALKVHYKGYDKFLYGEPCGCQSVTWGQKKWKSTFNKKEVNCKWCLKSLKAGKKIYIAGGKS